VKGRIKYFYIGAFAYRSTMKFIEVIVLGLLSTVCALATWYYLFTTTGGSDGPFGPIYTALIFPPLFALLFLLIRVILKRRANE